MQKLTISHRIANLFLATLLTYAIGILIMILAYARTSGYRPPVTEYFVVPLVMGYQNPIVTGGVLAFCLVLVHLLWTKMARQRTQSICETNCLRMPSK